MNSLTPPPQAPAVRRKQVLGAGQLRKQKLACLLWTVAAQLCKPGSSVLPSPGPMSLLKMISSTNGMLCLKRDQVTSSTSGNGPSWWDDPSRKFFSVSL